MSHRRLYFVVSRLSFGSAQVQNNRPYTHCFYSCRALTQLPERGRQVVGFFVLGMGGFCVFVRVMLLLHISVYTVHFRLHIERPAKMVFS